MATNPAIFLITVYQRYLSPHKGYCCAHASLHQGDSCSQAVKAIIKQHGIWRGRQLIRQRFAACQAAYQQLQEDSYQRKQRKKAEKDNATECCGDCAGQAACEAGWQIGAAACSRGGSALSHGCHGIDLPCACGL